MRAAVSKPFIVGMLTSRRMAAKSASISFCNASVPERALIRFSPSMPSIASYDSSLCGWSSTRRMLTLSSFCFIALPSPSAGAAAPLRVQPHAQHRQQLAAVHRLGDVIRRPGLQAFFPVAFHRLRRKGDDRQPPELRNVADPPYGLIAV